MVYINSMPSENAPAWLIAMVNLVRSIVAGIIACVRVSEIVADALDGEDVTPEVEEVQEDGTEIQ